ncbi:siderophore ABC transporter substrate-binding protein [Halalkalibacter nanhaiisediminis]|uniref:Iron complex transport system substrate-binding protein n=1 Tax=Halalkalibacter nanhaiisediminis TaxID=688079 RepID=A0A562QJD3_9BACI|nr:siderophore ABC transporter substrate-binding protein [Halalkalibacter nanhaiisediminis]TWI56156.1 iron complex transport system substrate-binding protein [Halalkalibacter nanhaiisediminis]
MKKSLIFMFMLMLLAVFVAACGSNSATDTPAEETPAEEEETDVAAEEEPAAEEETEITIQHDLGETVVSKNPSKVVVFDMGVLDTLDALGVEEVVAVPKGNIPEYLAKYDGVEYTNVGSLKEPDFETIYDIQPDLIIISGRTSDAYEELSGIAPTIFMGLDTANYMESFTANVKTLAEIFGKEDVAEEQLAAIQESASQLNEKATASEAQGLIVLANDGAISAYGPGSRFGLLHDVFGVTPVDKNIEVSTHGQNVSFEYIVEKDPKYLFVVDRGAVVGGESPGKQTIENELVQGTQAYQEGNIVYLDPVNWYISGGGLTSVSEMIKEVDVAIE